MTKSKIPDGFVLDHSRGPFTSHNGPTYKKTVDGVRQVGMLVGETHCNGYGFLHGGMMSAFCDGALASAVWAATRRSAVTVRLSVDFLETVRLNDWIEAHAEVKGIDDPFVQVEARIIRNQGSLVATALGTFHLLRRTVK